MDEPLELGQRRDVPPAPTVQAAARLVRAFEDASLPRNEWTHAAHLVVGLWFVLHHGRERACAIVSAGIDRYNRVSGRTAAERDGYDEEVTRTWIDRIAAFAGSATPADLDDALLSRLYATFLGPTTPRSTAAKS